MRTMFISEFREFLEKNPQGGIVFSEDGNDIHITNPDNFGAITFLWDDFRDEYDDDNIAFNYDWSLADYSDADTVQVYEKKDIDIVINLLTKSRIMYENYGLK